MRQNAKLKGSIPAHAGEPSWQTTSRTTRRVYPRACGGTASVMAERRPPPRQGSQVYGSPACAGIDPWPEAPLSPRMRGNPVAVAVAGAGAGSIPAHAGEPPPGSSWRRPRRVYPRACGGTLNLLANLVAPTGLSPRMRGNPPTRESAGKCAGSIPAHAGEPIDDTKGTTVRRVYPRACGGTFGIFSTLKDNVGLSPRMRGNQGVAGLWVRALRSIPAHAGEPLPEAARRTNRGVYPRACGGTDISPPCAVFVQGLSPRMRGNRAWGR